MANLQDNVIQAEIDAKCYTGVGSRNTPQSVLQIMHDIAVKLSDLGYTLRSGGADGADKAFESGTNDKEIYTIHHASQIAMAIAAKFHPAWNHCNQYVKRLHGRNVFQVLGVGLHTPSKFLICWTPDACISHNTRTRRTGGTGTAISIADYYNVKIFNLGNLKHCTRIVNSLQEKQ